MLLWACPNQGQAQPLMPSLGYTPALDTLSVQVVPHNRFHATRFWVGTGTIVGTDLAVMAGLNQLWYSGYERTGFHWHNDWPNWKQQDKLGHLVTAWHIARVFGAYGTWTGLSPKQAGWYGFGVSALFQTQIEVLDGFSEAWGASWGDLLFNTVGGALGGLQTADPRWEAVTIKYSYHRSPFEDPTENYIGNALKDYDGISYWLVVRPHELGATGWPQWLGLSLGHSADGLAEALPTAASPHQRVWFVGLDLDVLRTVRWPKPWMGTVAGILSFIRIPAPALEVSPRPRWHWVYH